MVLIRDKANMTKRVLGTNQYGEALEVCAIGLGCMGLNQGYPPFPPKEEGISFLQKAVELGEDFFDTSELYGFYKNEELVGEALQSVRNKVKIATKFGWNIKDGKLLGLDSSPKAIKKAVEGSLKRLRTDHIDIYYQHRVDPDVPIEDVALVMESLYKEGKILHWGLSEAGLNTLERANSVFKVTAVQYEYSLWCRELEKTLMPVLEKLHIGLAAFSPLGKGMLAGKFKKAESFAKDDYRSTVPRMNNQEMMEHNLQIVDKIEDFAKERNCTVAQLSLAFILHQKSYVVPIPGTTKISRLQENLKAMDLSLTESDWQEFNHLTSSMVVEGERFGREAEPWAGNEAVSR